MSVQTYEYYIRKLSQYADSKLKELLLAEVNRAGWTNTRAVYLVALKQVARQRDLIL